MNDFTDEINAMQTIDSALSKLSEEERQRVMAWASSKYAITIKDSSSVPPSDDNDAEGEEDDKLTPQFSHFVDLFDAANPSKARQQVLIAAYWYQGVLGNESFTAQQLNNELKNTGHGAANITNTLSRLQTGKPALIRQISKSGRSQQARKKYKLTTAGLAQAEGMIAS